MIFQSPELSRLIIIFIPQPIIAILVFFLAFRVSQRKHSTSSLTLVAYYISIGLAMIMNIVYYISTIVINSNLLLIYLIALFLFLYPIIYLPLFIITLLKTKDDFSLKKYFSYLIIYCFIIISLYFIPNGIKLTDSGSPIYSLEFSILFLTVLILMIVIPTGIYSYRLYSTFLDQELKKKLSKVLYGISLIFITMIGATIFNTSLDPLFKSIWSFAAVILMISASLFIYYGLGKDL
jgi:hypothetical protein